MSPGVLVGVACPTSLGYPHVRQACGCDDAYLPPVDARTSTDTVQIAAEPCKHEWQANASCNCGGMSLRSANVVVRREPILLRGASAVQPHAVGVSGRVSIVRSTRHRSLDISLECAPMYGDGGSGPSQTGFFELGMSGA